MPRTSSRDMKKYDILELADSEKDINRVDRWINRYMVAEIDRQIDLWLNVKI